MASPYHNMSQESRLYRDGDRNNGHNHHRYGDEHRYNRNQEPVHLEPREEESMYDNWSNSPNNGSYNGFDGRNNPRVHFEVSLETPRPSQPRYDPRRRDRRAEIEEAIRRAEEVLPRRSGGSGTHGRQAEIEEAIRRAEEVPPRRGGGSGSYGRQAEIEEAIRRAEEVPPRRGGGSGSHGSQAEARDTHHQFDKNFRRGGSGSHARRH